MRVITEICFGLLRGKVIWRTLKFFNGQFTSIKSVDKALRLVQTCSVARIRLGCFYVCVIQLNNIFFLNGPTPTSFSFIFNRFKQTSLHFLQQICVKKCP